MEKVMLIENILCQKQDFERQSQKTVKHGLNGRYQPLGLSFS